MGLYSAEKLVKLMQLDGVDDNTLADALLVSFDDLLHWQESSVPDAYWRPLAEYFSVAPQLFDHDLADPAMIDKLVWLYWRGIEYCQHMVAQRIADYRMQPSSALDLTDLGLGVVDLPAALLDLPQLRSVDLSNNLLTDICPLLQTLIERGCTLLLKQNFLPAQTPEFYNLSPLKQFAYARLRRLQLRHIGLFDQASIDFNDDLTVLVGLNGAGKTTLFKALCLAILGVRPETQACAAQLHQIGLEDGRFSQIVLHADIYWQGVETPSHHRHEIRLQRNWLTNTVESSTTAFGEAFEILFKDSHYLQQLILGLSERRGHPVNPHIRQPNDSARFPEVRDLLPMINMSAQSCFDSFTRWWANLEYLKRQADLTYAPDFAHQKRIAQQQISSCFQIFSEVIGESIDSAGLRRVDPPDLWVQYASGRQVPFDLVSQGYQFVMSWIGWMVERMFAAYPQSAHPLAQPAIVMIDEIDQFLSIKWQQQILAQLRKHFPQVQWIVSTHSPMVLTDLEQDQLIQLTYQQGRYVVQRNPVDLWMWQYGDLVRHFFEVSPQQPHESEAQLQQQIEQCRQQTPTAAQQHTLATLEQRYQRTIRSRVEADDFAKKLAALEKREQQLMDLMAQLSK